MVWFVMACTACIALSCSPSPNIRIINGIAYEELELTTSEVIFTCAYDAASGSLRIMLLNLEKDELLFDGWTFDKTVVHINSPTYRIGIGMLRQYGGSKVRCKGTVLKVHSKNNMVYIVTEIMLIFPERKKRQDHPPVRREPRYIGALLFPCDILSVNGKNLL